MKFEKYLKNIVKPLLKLVFPVKCYGCNIFGYYVCPNCAQRILRYKNKRCPFCLCASQVGRLCYRCQKKYFLKQVMILTYYDQALIQKLIQAMKYSSVYLIARDLAQVLYLNFKTYLTTNKLAFIPVPAHKKKITNRGFNQAVLLARHLSRITKLPVNEELLLKIKNTQAQMQLKNKEKRKNNQANAFVVNKQNIKKFKNLEIVLIDDVLTTGSTLIECAKVLNQAGFQNITAIVLARQTL
ncbi:MAG: hypothetical protein GF332_04030 [Candidatus Moranbacteria bacterium]|nr:hypothetical protein [Candidatus Moranbacteria bacterium]